MKDNAQQMWVIIILFKPFYFMYLSMMNTQHLSQVNERKLRFSYCFATLETLFSPHLPLGADNFLLDTQPVLHQSRQTGRNQSAGKMRLKPACAAVSFYSSSVSCESSFCPSPCALHLNLPSPDASLLFFLSQKWFPLCCWYHPKKIKNLEIKMTL